MAVWRFPVHDLRTNTLLGELPQLGGVRLTERLNGRQEMSATVDLAGRSSPTRAPVVVELVENPPDSGFIDIPADWVVDPDDPDFYTVPGVA